jgi:hypothetical protein
MLWLIKRQVNGAALQQNNLCRTNNTKAIALAYLMIKFGNKWTKPEYVN